MKKFHEKAKQKFDWDVTALPDYTDEQNQEIIEDLIASSTFLSKLRVQTGNKGSELIKLLSSDPAIQSAADCGWTPQGGVVFTDETLTTVRLKIQEEYCNEDLNGTWAQIMNAVGANRQDQEMVMEQAMIAYYIKKTQRKIQKLVIKGDEASLDPDLAHFDGMVKQFTDSGDMQVATFEDPTITADNAFDVLIAVEAKIPNVVKDNELDFEIICPRQVAQDCLTQIYNAKDYASSIEVTRENGQISFILPTTGTRVTSNPDLEDSEVYAVVYDYMFYGTDVDGDENGYEVKYNEHDEKMRVGVKWRSGFKAILLEYFVKLEMTVS